MVFFISGIQIEESNIDPGVCQCLDGLGVEPASILLTFGQGQMKYGGIRFGCFGALQEGPDALGAVRRNDDLYRLRLGQPANGAAKRSSDPGCW